MVQPKTEFFRFLFSAGCYFTAELRPNFFLGPHTEPYGNKSKVATEWNKKFSSFFSAKLFKSISIFVVICLVFLFARFVFLFHLFDSFKVFSWARNKQTGALQKKRKND